MISVSLQYLPAFRILYYLIVTTITSLLSQINPIISTLAHYSHLYVNAPHSPSELAAPPTSFYQESCFPLLTL